MRRKEELYLICLKHIDERIDNVQERLTDIEEARNRISDAIYQVESDYQQEFDTSSKLIKHLLTKAYKNKWKYLWNYDRWRSKKNCSEIL